MRPFWTALQFLTCIPTPSYEDIDVDSQGKSVLYYPLIGLLIGLILLCLAWLLSPYPPVLQASIILFAWVVITGALHLDGLSDWADAWWGGLGSRERTLEIMKDPCCGTMGVVSITLVLLLKFSLLFSLLPLLLLGNWPVLLVAPMLGRSMAISLLLTAPYVRKEGIASSWVDSIPRAGAWIVVLLSLVITGWWFLLDALVIFAGLVFLLWLWRMLMIRRLQGITGDTIGALVELSELAVLLMFVLRSL